MVWSTVSSKSCFCWLYTTFPSSAMRNVISLISVLTIWWYPCGESSLVLLKKGVCYDSWILLAEFGYPLSCFILYSRPNSSVPPKYLLTSYFCIPVPYDEKDIFFLLLVLEHLIDLHRTVQLQLLQHQWLGQRFGLLWYWMVWLETNQDDSVIFTVTRKYCISDSFVDYEGYSISSMGFLPTVVDIMVIWIKFTHSHPF